MLYTLFYTFDFYLDVFSKVLIIRYFKLIK